MLTGRFDIILRSPMGPRKGTLTFFNAGCSSKGVLSLFGIENPIQELILKDNLCLFWGEIITRVSKVDYAAEATIVGKDLIGIFLVKNVKMTMKGSRT